MATPCLKCLEVVYWVNIDGIYIYIYNLNNCMYVHGSVKDKTSLTEPWIFPYFSDYSFFFRMSFKIALFAFLITSTNPQFPWNRAPPQASQDDFWHSMGNDWETSNTIRQTNPYLNWYYQQQNQMDLFAPAIHVGKINRSSYSNPEANMPRHQAYGINHDFNPEDLQQGAFKRKPKGQNLVANQVHFVFY